MKLDVNLSRLIRQRSSIGAERVTWRSIRSRQHTQWLKRELLRMGKEVGIVELSVDSDNKLVKDGKQYLAHIKETRESRESLSTAPKLRFHVCFCEHLRKMKEIDRYDSRYVQTTRKNGKFYVLPVRPHGAKPSSECVQAKLRVCKWCLGELKWKGFDYHAMGKSQQEQIQRDFSIEEYFNLYNEENDFDVPMDYEVNIDDGYPENWQSISESVRMEAGWACEECGVKLEDAKWLLQVHHINGKLRDCNRNNLQALCCECHANQPLHEQIEVSGTARMKMRKIRAEQNCFMNM